MKQIQSRELDLLVKATKSNNDRVKAFKSRGRPLKGQRLTDRLRTKLSQLSVQV